MPSDTRYRRAASTTARDELLGRFDHMAKRYDAPVDTRIARHAIFGRISMFCAARAAICGKEAATDNASTLPRLNRKCEQREPCHSAHLDVCFSKRGLALQRMGCGGLHRLLYPQGTLLQVGDAGFQCKCAPYPIRIVRCRRLWWEWGSEIVTARCQ